MAYVLLKGAWIDGPLVDDENLVLLRVPQAIEWPRGEDGTVELILVDQNLQAVVLNISGGDSLTLYVGFDFTTGSQFEVAAVAASDPGRYAFTVPGNVTRDFYGPMVYEVRAKRSGKVQQVASPARFDVTPRVSSS